MVGQTNIVTVFKDNVGEIERKGGAHVGLLEPYSVTMSRKRKPDLC